MKRNEMVLILLVVVLIMVFALMVNTTSSSKAAVPDAYDTIISSVVTASTDPLQSSPLISRIESILADDTDAQPSDPYPFAIIDNMARTEEPVPFESMKPFNMNKEQDMPKIDPTRPVVALTFDDGPSQYTQPILDTLSKYGAVATFFIVGNRIEYREDILYSIFEQGSEIANHSWDHANLAKMKTEDEVIANLQKTIDAVSLVTGFTPSLMRPPYGAVDAEVIRASTDLGLPIIMWSVDTLDWKNRDAKAVHDNIMEHVQNGSIILMHDLYESTAEAMKTVIPELVAQGYQLVTVTEMLEYLDGELIPGNIYH